RPGSRVASVPVCPYIEQERIAKGLQLVRHCPQCAQNLRALSTRLPFRQLKSVGLELSPIGTAVALGRTHATLNLSRYRSRISGRRSCLDGLPRDRLPA